MKYANYTSLSYAVVRVNVVLSWMREMLLGEHTA